MIDRFTIRDLSKLVLAKTAPHVTFYLSTRNSGREIYSPAKTLKQLATVAKTRLSGSWMSEAEADRFLEPVTNLIDDDQFWQHTESGLALFLTAEGLQKWRCAISFSDEVFVSSRFFVRPILPAVAGDELFFILAISQNKTGLYEADEYEIRNVDVPELPQDLEATLNLTSVGRISQTHMGNRGQGGRPSSIFHGQGGKRDTSKDEVQQFFRHVNKAVTRRLNGMRHPMILACVESEASIYSKVNTYPHLMDEFVAGNADRMTGSQIHDLVMPFIKAHVGKTRSSAIEECRDNLNTTRTMSEVSAIVSSAHAGRIDKLFINQSATLPGEFNPNDQTIDYNVSTMDHSRDLIEQTIAQTLSHRGDVYALSENEMPASSIMVATLRY